MNDWLHDLVFKTQWMGTVCWSTGDIESLRFEHRDGEEEEW